MKLYSKQIANGFCDILNSISAWMRHGPSVIKGLRACFCACSGCCTVIGSPLAGLTSADRSVYMRGVLSFLDWRIPPSMTNGFVQLAARKLTNQRVTMQTRFRGAPNHWKESTNLLSSAHINPSFSIFNLLNFFDFAIFDTGFEFLFF